jgi:hypothetical protein
MLGWRSGRDRGLRQNVIRIGAMSKAFFADAVHVLKMESWNHGKSRSDEAGVPAPGRAGHVDRT